MSRDRLLGKSPSELRTIAEEARKELFRLRMQAAVGQLPKIHEIRQTRRRLARALTRLHEARRREEDRS